MSTVVWYTISHKLNFSDEIIKHSWILNFPRSRSLPVSLRRPLGMKQVWRRSRLLYQRADRGSSAWAFFTFSQAFDLALWSVVLCRLLECTIIWVWSQGPNKCHLPRSTAANSSRRQWTCANAWFKGCLRHLPVCRSVPRLWPVRKTWRSLFGGFARGIICDVLCDVLIGW